MRKHGFVNINQIWLSGTILLLNASKLFYLAQSYNVGTFRPVRVDYETLSAHHLKTLKYAV